MSDVSVRHIDTLNSYINHANALSAAVSQAATLLSNRLDIVRDNARNTVSVIEDEVEELREEKENLQCQLNGLKKQLNWIEDDPDGSERNFIRKKMDDVSGELIEIRDRLAIRFDDLVSARDLQNRVEIDCNESLSELHNLINGIPSLIDGSIQFMHKYMSYLRQAQSQK